jgi:pectinesterase
VAFLSCELDNVINPKGWDNWSNPQNELTATFSEYNNTGAGAALGQRVSWSKVLTAKDTELYTIEKVLGGWIPDNK